MKEFDVAQETLKQIAQSLLETKKMARSIENTADAFLPLTDNEQVRGELQNIAQAGRMAGASASILYNLVAREAAKE
jgi:hypothetical protein